MLKKISFFVIFFIFSKIIESKKIKVSISNRVLDLDHIDPKVSSFSILANLHEPLLRISETGSVSPGIAKSWSIKKNRVIFTLRDSYFSSGEKIESIHFVEAFKKILLNTKYAYRYFIIKNAKNFVSGIVDFSEVGIEALSKNELAITFENVVEDPIRVYGSIFSFISFSPFYEEKYSGPYYLESNNLRSIVLKKNPYYYKDIEIDEIEFIFIENSFKAIEQFRKGNIDLVLNLKNPELISGLDIKKYTRDAKTTYIAINTKKIGVNLRKAIAKCIDRRALSKYLLKESSEPAYAFIPNNYLGFKSTFRSEAGLKLFEDKVYLDNFKQSFSILIDNSLTSIRIAQFLQNELKKIGIFLKIEIKSLLARKSLVISKNYDMVLTSWAVDHYSPPFDFLTQFLSYADDNITNWNSPNFDASIEKAKKSYKLKDIYFYLIQAERCICSEQLGEFPIVPLIFNQSYYMINNKLKGVKLYSGASSLDFREAYFE